MFIHPSSILFCCATELELKNIPVGIGRQFISGIGIAETFLSLYPLLQTNKIKQIINIGIAGAYPNQSSLKIGDITLSTCECYADLGFETKKGSFIPLFKTEFVKDRKNTFILASYPKWMLDGVQFEFSTKEIFSGTVQQCTGTLKTGLQRKNDFNISTESMEGAAVVQLANHFNIPVWEIRAISNYASTRDMTSENIQIAFKNLKRYLKWMVSQFEWKSL